MIYFECVLMCSELPVQNLRHNLSYRVFLVSENIFLNIIFSRLHARGDWSNYGVILILHTDYTTNIPSWLFEKTIDHVLYIYNSLPKDH